MQQTHTLQASGLEHYLPLFLTQGGVGGLKPWQWLGLLLGAVLALLFGMLLERVVLAAANRVARLTKVNWDDHLIAAARGPMRLLLFAALLALLTRWLDFHDKAQEVSDLVSRSAIIYSCAWYLLRLFRMISDWVQAKAVGTDPDEALRMRGLRTQVTVLRHVLDFTVVVVSAALFLMQFQMVRTVGVSLLASAGLAGLVLGLAAQKTISNLLAGIQLSITQPVRIGDTVIVEGEWGWIDELTLTYVVVRTWDVRRLIIPIGNFLEKPFQNWSRVNASMLGTVEIRADYSANVDAFRAELDRLLADEGKALWDGKAKGVQVTDASERTILIRCLVSADPAKLWDLRCLVREKMIVFMAQHPGWMPVVRNETLTAPMSQVPKARAG